MKSCKNIFAKLISLIKTIQVKFLLVTLLSSTINISYSADILYNRKIQDQLTHLYVSDIVKDSLGFMWFGTSRGLNRWDGYTFKYFLSDINDPNSISNNKILDLLIDDHNFIWVATSNGLNKFDPKNETFTHYLHTNGDSTSIPSNTINCLSLDQKGNLWIGTTEGLCYLDKQSNKIVNVSYNTYVPQSGNYVTIRSIFCDSENNKWIGFNHGGLLRIHADGKIEFVETFNINGQLTYLPSINNTIEDKDGNIYLATWGLKIVVFDKKSGEFKFWAGNSNLKTNIVEHLVCDSDNNLWVSDHLISLVYCTIDGKLIETFSTNNGKQSIPSPHISRISVAGEMVYVGTYNHGFFLIEYTTKPLQNLTTHLMNDETDGKIQTLSIAYIPPNQLFVGTSNNIAYLYNEDTKEFTALPHRQTYVKTATYNPNENHVWVGSYSDEIYSYNVDKKQFEKEFDLDLLSTQFVIETNDSLVILAVWADGIRIYNRKTKQLYHPGITKQEQSLEILDLCLEGDTLWICSNNNGFISYSLKDDKFKHYSIDYLSKSIRPSNQFNLVKKLSNGKLLVNSNEIGVCYFNKSSETFSMVGEEIGISDAHVKEFVEDDQNNVWIITDKKAVKTDYNFSSYTELSATDGLHYGIEHSAAVFSPNSKNIYVGSQSGLQYYSTESLNFRQDELSQTIITDIKIFDKSLPINGKELHGSSITYTDTIILNRKQNSVSIDFSSMNYNPNSTSKYAYRLLGLNSSWNYSPSTKNSITYSNLIPGDYTFEVKVSNNHGMWNEKATHFHIKILPPFWQSGWFRFIIMIIVVSVIVVFIKLREYNLIQDNKKLERIVQERTTEVLDQKFQVELQKEELEKANDVKNKFFSIIAHDLRNPVGAIVQLTSLLKENFEVFTKKQLGEIIRATSNSADTTMELLEDLLIWASSQTNKITYNFEFIKVHAIADNEITNLSHQARNKDIKIENNISKNIEVYADLSTIKTVFRNLISNAIKFSNTESIIEIGSRYQETYLVIYVKDYGVGIKPEKLKELFTLNQKNSTEGTSGEKGSGLGLSLCHEFVTKNKGRIWVESELGLGSTFYFTLPYR